MVFSARTEQLEAENEKLKKENKRLRNEVEINEVTVKDKVTETRKAKDKILALTSRLEEAQGQLVQVKAQSEAKNELVLANVSIFAVLITILSNIIYVYRSFELL